MRKCGFCRDVKERLLLIFLLTLHSLHSYRATIWQRHAVLINCYLNKLFTRNCYLCTLIEQFFTASPQLLPPLPQILSSLSFMNDAPMCVNFQVRLFFCYCALRDQFSFKDTKRCCISYFRGG